MFWGPGGMAPLLGFRELRPYFGRVWGAKSRPGPKISRRINSMKSEKSPKTLLDFIVLRFR